MGDIADMPTIRSDKEFHPEYKILTKVLPSNFGVRGKILQIQQWRPEQDGDVEYLRDNFDEAPIPWKTLVENVTFDFVNRYMGISLNFDARPTGTWFNNANPWIFDGPIRMEGLTDEFSMVCHHYSDNVTVWSAKTAVLSEGQSIVYHKPTGVKAAALFVLDQSVDVNGILVDDTIPYGISEDVLNITARTRTVLLIRELID